MSQPAAKKPRLDTEAEAAIQIAQTRYHGNVGQGESRNIYGNVINTYNVGLREAPRVPESAEGGPSSIVDNIESLLGTLRFEEMYDRLATVETAHLDTCQWLFTRDEYKAWRDPQASRTHQGFFLAEGETWGW